MSAEESKPCRDPFLIVFRGGPYDGRYGTRGDGVGQIDLRAPKGHYVNTGKVISNGAVTFEWHAGSYEPPLIFELTYTADDPAPPLPSEPPLEQSWRDRPPLL